MEPPFESPAFNVSTQSTGDGVTVAVSGEIDVNAVPAFRAAIDTARPVRDAALTLDLSQVSFIDSSGISVLVAASKDARVAAMPLTIICGPEVRRVLELAGLADRLPLS